MAGQGHRISDAERKSKVQIMRRTRYTPRRDSEASDQGIAVQEMVGAGVVRATQNLN